MLTTPTLERILARLPALTVGVAGDLFCDRYLDIDAALTEPSIETGLDAYQVVRVRSVPGAAGTIVNNLVALGVGRVTLASVLGDDGEGYELRQALADLAAVETRFVLTDESIRTPTYTKPMLRREGEPPRELNRLDIKNRTPVRSVLEESLLHALEALWPSVDALVVLDQVSEADCGVVTARVRDKLRALGERNPGKLILADSRERIGQFQAVSLKPNQAECRRAVFGPEAGPETTAEAARTLARRAGRPVFCTCGEHGILLAAADQLHEVPPFPVAGPVDPVGAGDSTSAGIAAAVAAGATLAEAAAFGNLVASITIQQLGTTGTASPEMVRRRWQAVASG